MMRYELILGGVMLLACALPVKALWEKMPLARLALCFNVLWSVLVAFHLSGAVCGMIGGYVAGMGSIPPEIVAFWLMFVVSALPGWAFVRWGLSNSTTDLPLFFERGTGILATTTVALLLPCLVLMTVAILPLQTRVLPSAGALGQGVAVMQQVPLEFYLRTVSATVDPGAAEQRRRQLPGGLQRLARLPSLIGDG